MTQRGVITWPASLMQTSVVTLSFDGLHLFNTLRSPFSATTLEESGENCRPVSSQFKMYSGLSSSFTAVQRQSDVYAKSEILRKVPKTF
ncbi:hypothetical protein ElyMa_001627700 [Elysia marginata]|uniref:Uncharacterized protein n=1 Tax=Elysia marginata TaxID=1093978 RepID=A0AAV4JLF3_9GAST|nr:hypothetical protein ElyMa_001627700 [Elysia marginata]